MSRATVTPLAHYRSLGLRIGSKVPQDSLFLQLLLLLLRPLSLALRCSPCFGLCAKLSGSSMVAFVSRGQ